MHHGTASSTTPDGTTRYVGPHYEVGPAKITRDVTPVNWGVACIDNATGSGYLLYSAESVYTRLAAHPPFGSNADHFICVRYNNGWQYDTNIAYYSFAPRDTDILVAAVDDSADTITSLAGQSGTVNGITTGYAAGDLTFYADQWRGNTNDGEFTVSGSTFTPNETTKYYYFGGQRVATARPRSAAAGDAAREYAHLPPSCGYAQDRLRPRPPTVAEAAPVWRRTPAVA